MKSSDSAKRSLAGTVTMLLGLVAALLMFFSFAYEPGGAISVSNKPTFKHGDIIITNKFAYGFSDVSCLKFFGVNLSGVCGALNNDNARTFGTDPERGDIIAFKERSSGVGSMKRVIGLPGESISLEAGKIYIDSVAVHTVAVGTFDEPLGPPADLTAAQLCSDRGNGICHKDQFRETLPNGKSYVVLDAGITWNDTVGPFEVPEGHFFVLGDNRDNSADSRVGIGYIARGDIVGKISVVLASRDPRQPFMKSWRKDRFFMRPN
jgi:signal peptidase I